MSNQPALSVIVPFYGVEDYIEECLESIEHQTLADIQVILVDDGSPDNSIEIAQKFVDRDSRFQLVRQENAGLGPARNTGQQYAEGRYLTFVDSDDIVPGRAYEDMVTSLDRTGSSFAVGNARRFSRTSGVRQSWAHSKAGVAARSVPATHIFERPGLAYDRMVWNKVYRTSFYTEHGYQFPPIKYEDWPVTMRAHLEALTVDLIHTPIYYWRERESGDSITQQVFNYDNLLDRVTSAEQVLTLLDTGATPGTRRMAHRHLMEIDMVALAQSFAVADDTEAERLLALAHRLIDRLEPPASNETRYNQLQYLALKQGNIEQLRALAKFRDEGGLVGGTRVKRRPFNPLKWTLNYPGRGKLKAPANLYEIPFTALKLKTLVTSVQWHDDVLKFEITAQIEHLRSSVDDDVVVNLVNGIDRIPLQVEKFDTIDAYRERGPVGVRFSVSLQQMRELNDVVWPLRFEVSRRSEGVTRTLMLTGAGAGSPQFPAGEFLSGSEYVQPGLTAGNVYCLHRVAFPTVIQDAQEHDGSIELRGLVPDAIRTANLLLKRPGTDVEFATSLRSRAGGTEFVTELDAAAALQGDSADDPFLHTATRNVSLSTEFGDLGLTWATYDLDQSVVVDERLVTLTRSRFGLAQLGHGPILPVVDRVWLTPDTLTIEGRQFGLEIDGCLTWRKYLPNSDEHVDIEFPVTVSDAAFSATLPVADLIPSEDLPTQPGAPAADYTLFFTSDHHETPLRIAPSALGQLPIEHFVNGRTILATSIAGGARLQVR